MLKGELRYIDGQARVRKISKQTVLELFALVLIGEARESCQTEQLEGSEAWEKDIRLYALQSVALDQERQCITQAGDELATEIGRWRFGR